MNNDSHEYSIHRRRPTLSKSGKISRTLIMLFDDLEQAKENCAYGSSVYDEYGNKVYSKPDYEKMWNELKEFIDHSQSEFKNLAFQMGHYTSGFDMYYSTSEEYKKILDKMKELEGCNNE